MFLSSYWCRCKSTKTQIRNRIANYPMIPTTQKSSVHNFIPAMVTAAALLLTTLHAGAIIGTSLQMQLGNPSSATADPNNHSHYLVQRTVEALDFGDVLGEPNWASWDLTSSDIG